MGSAGLNLSCSLVQMSDKHLDIPVRVQATRPAGPTFGGQHCRGVRTEVRRKDVTSGRVCAVRTGGGRRKQHEEIQSSRTQEKT